MHVTGRERALRRHSLITRITMWPLFLGLLLFISMPAAAVLTPGALFDLDAFNNDGADDDVWTNNGTVGGFLEGKAGELTPAGRLHEGGPPVRHVEEDVTYYEVRTNGGFFGPGPAITSMSSFTGEIWFRRSVDDAGIGVSADQPGRGPHMIQFFTLRNNDDRAIATVRTIGFLDPPTEFYFYIDADETFKLHSHRAIIPRFPRRSTARSRPRPIPGFRPC